MAMLKEKKKEWNLCWRDGKEDSSCAQHRWLGNQHDSNEKKKKGENRIMK